MAADRAPKGADPMRRLAIAFTTLGLAIAVLLVSAVVVLLQSASSGPSAVLRRAAEWVDEQETARLDVSRSARSRPGAAGTSELRSARGEGDVAFPDRLRLVLRAEGGDAVEIVAVGDETFRRTADAADAGGAGTAGRRWDAATVRPGGELLLPARPAPIARAAVDAPPATSTPAVDPAAGAGVPDLDLRLVPELLRLAAGADEVERVGTEDGAAVVRAELPRRAVEDLSAGAAEGATITAAIQSGGRLDRLEVALVLARGAALDVEVTFSRWGSAAEGADEIAAPPEDVVDRTPGIDEDAIAGFTSAPLLAPAGVASGWELIAALPVDRGDGCPRIQLEYADPDSPDAGSLRLVERSTACGGQPAPDGARQYTVGRSARGYLVDVPGGYGGVLLVDGTAVEFESDLFLNDLSVVLADLRPLVLGQEPANLGRLRLKR